MGHCMFLRKGETHTAPVTYAANFADNTWEQIIEACQKNAVPDTWLVADQKTMTINGTDYLIDIIGKNHDIYSDGSGTAPLTFQMHDCYDVRYPMNQKYATNSGGWGNCNMRTSYLPGILSLMPSNIQIGIKEVNKLTSAGSKSSTINTTADKLFLLSEIEVFGSATYSYEGEGTQYAYYAAGNSKVKNRGGSASAWGERSPYKSDSGNFGYVSASGTADISAASGYRGVPFAFCF